MEKYYTEIQQQIEDYIKEKKYTLALALVEQELNMPYIPGDFESFLQKTRKDLRFYLKEDTSEKEYSLDTLQTFLDGRPEQQMFAVEALTKRNLRTETEMIQSWLQKNPYPEAAALMIEALAEQEIGEEFTFVKDGIEYTFWPDDVVPVSRCQGFKVANRYLQKWLQTDNPDLYEMAKVLLVHEVYMALPLSYDKEEGYTLATQCVQQVSQLMNRDDILNLIGKEESMLYA